MFHRRAATKRKKEKKEEEKNMHYAIEQWRPKD
jgi:hypothetical protein